MGLHLVVMELQMFTMQVEKEPTVNLNIYNSRTTRHNVCAEEDCETFKSSATVTKLNTLWHFFFHLLCWRSTENFQSQLNSEIKHCRQRSQHEVYCPLDVNPFDLLARRSRLAVSVSLKHTPTLTPLKSESTSESSRLSSCGTFLFFSRCSSRLFWQEDKKRNAMRGEEKSSLMHWRILKVKVNLGLTQKYFPTKIFICWSRGYM